MFVCITSSQLEVSIFVFVADFYRFFEDLLLALLCSVLLRLLQVFDRQFRHPLDAEKRLNEVL